MAAGGRFDLFLDSACQIYNARYPKAESEPSIDGITIVANPERLTIAKLGPEIKRGKANFRKAVDSGRKSGGGRIVLALHDECHEILSINVGRIALLREDSQQLPREDSRQLPREDSQ